MKSTPKVRKRIKQSTKVQSCKPSKYAIVNLIKNPKSNRPLLLFVHLRAHKHWTPKILFSGQIKKKLVIKLDLQNIMGTHTKKKKGFVFLLKDHVQASATTSSLTRASPVGVLLRASLAGALLRASVSIAED